MQCVEEYLITRDGHSTHQLFEKIVQFSDLSLSEIRTQSGSSEPLTFAHWSLVACHPEIGW